MKNGISWLHVDMDSYFASCEQQANPQLRGKPVGVCGDPQGESTKDGTISRSVIAAASKEAKEFGVKSGMPPFKARKLCSDILLVPADGAKYKDITSRFLSIFESYSPRVEPFSIDEAFLKVDFLENREESPKKLALTLQKQVEEELGSWITCSCGLGPNKFLAKVASDLRKPEGVFLLDRDNKKEVFQSLELSDVFGIGEKTAKQLQKLGIESLAELDEASLAKLQEKFGQRALALKKIARGNSIASLQGPCLGLKNKELSPQDPPKSRGRSQTLSHDHPNLNSLKPKLLEFGKELARSLREAELVAETVKLELTFKDLSSFSRQKKMGVSVQDEVKIFKQASALLNQAPQEGAVRKVGLKLKGLKPQRQPFLFKKDRQRKNLLKAQDEIETEFGSGTLKPLRTL